MYKYVLLALGIVTNIPKIYAMEGEHKAQADNRVISNCAGYQLPTPIENIVCDYLDVNDVAVQETPRSLSRFYREDKSHWGCLYCNQCDALHDAPECKPMIFSYKKWKSALESERFKRARPTRIGELTYSPVKLPEDEECERAIYINRKNNPFNGFRQHYPDTSQDVYEQQYRNEREREIRSIQQKKELEKKQKELDQQHALDQYIDRVQKVGFLDLFCESFLVGDLVKRVSVRNQARELRAPYQPPIQPKQEPVSAPVIPIPQPRTWHHNTTPLQYIEDSSTSLTLTSPTLLTWIDKKAQHTQEKEPLVPALMMPPIQQSIVNSEPQEEQSRSYAWLNKTTAWGLATIICVASFVWYLKKVR